MFPPRPQTPRDALLPPTTAPSPPRPSPAAAHAAQIPPAAAAAAATTAHSTALVLAASAAAASTAAARALLARCEAAQETVAAAAAAGDARPAVATLAAAASAAAGVAGVVARGEREVWAVVGPVVDRRAGVLDLDDGLLWRVLEGARRESEVDAREELPGAEDCGGEVVVPGAAFMRLAGVCRRWRRVLYAGVTAVRLESDRVVPRVGCLVAACPRLRRVEYGAGLSATGAAAATVALFSAVGATQRAGELLLGCDSAAPGKIGIYQQIRDALDPFLGLLRARGVPVSLYDSNKLWGKLMIGGSGARIFRLQGLRDLYVRDSRLMEAAGGERGGRSGVPARLRVLTLDRCEVSRTFLASVHRLGVKGEEQVRIRLFSTTLVDPRGADRVQDNTDYAALPCGRLVQSKAFDRLVSVSAMDEGLALSHARELVVEVVDEHY